MKYTINKSENVQGKSLRMGKYVRLSDIGDGWTTLPKTEKEYYYHMDKTVFIRTKDPDGTCHLQRRVTRENVHKIENRVYCRYRLAKDDTHEYILEYAEPMNGITWEKGVQYTRVYAQRPRARKNSPKTTVPVAQAQPQTLARDAWDDFLK